MPKYEILKDGKWVDAPKGAYVERIKWRPDTLFWKEKVWLCFFYFQLAHQEIKEEKEMSLFVYEKCGCVENTSWTSFFLIKEDSPTLCMECDPKIGKWHECWPKEKWDGERVVINREVEKK